MSFSGLRFPPLVHRAVLAASVLAVSVAVASSTVSSQAELPAQLTATEVTVILTTAASALSDAGLSVAVVDRSGRALGVYARPGFAPTSPDVALTVARTGAFFSNDKAPLSSRTIRFISGIHFPPGVPNTANAALYGIENTNRGCQLGLTDVAPFEPPRSLAGSTTIPGSPALPCNPNDPSGCARGGPIVMPDGTTNFQVGITTGKNSVFDRGSPLTVPTNPGGVPLFRNGRVVGGIGVAGVGADRAEYAAFVGATAAGLSPVPVDPLPLPGAVFIDGLRLPFFGACTTVECVTQSLMRRPAGTSPGGYSSADLLVAPRPGQAIPEGYLIGPVAGVGLTVEDVTRLVNQAIARADVTRAQIRLPFGQTTRMVIAVSDATGKILAAYRMADSTVFSFDVSVSKARNAFYFSSREGYEVLRNYVDNNPADDYRWEPEPPAGQGWAMTNRTLSFGGQPLFPPGIDLKKTPTAGPWFDLFNYDLLNPCTEGPGPSRGGHRAYPNQSGIVWFPGSAPIYKGGVLVGGIGVSGDGVEQDDYVTAGAVEGFDAPMDLRVDRSVIRTSSGEVVRLPYWKFPRNPEIR